jgi:hypothetical protein
MLNLVLTWKVEGRVTHGGRGYLCLQERSAKTKKRMCLWVRLPSSFVMPSKSSATTAFTFVELFQDMKPATAKTIIESPKNHYTQHEITADMNTGG